MMALPVIIYYIIFCYAPMCGAQIVFKHFNVAKGNMSSDWVGFKYLSSLSPTRIFSTDA